MKRALRVLALVALASCAPAAPPVEPLPTPAASVTAEPAARPTFAAASQDFGSAPPPSTTPSPPPTREERRVPSPSASDEGGSGVELVDPGAAPRRPLRVAWKTGTTSTATITIGVKAKMDSPAGALPASDVPKLRYTVLAKVTSASKDGVELAIVLRKVDVLSGGSDDVNKAIAGLAGRKGTIAMNARGVVTSSDLDAPSDAAPVARSAMDDLRETLIAMAPAFPDEAIGRGASWKVRVTVHAGGMSVKEVRTTKLVSAKGTRVELETTVKQSAEPQPLVAPGLPPDSDAKLTSFTGGGRGESAFDLAKPLPRRWKSEVGNDADVDVSIAGVGATMKVHTDATTTEDAK